MGSPSLDTALASIAAQDQCRIEVLLVAAGGPGHPPVPPYAGLHSVRTLGGAAPLDRPAAANAGLDAASGDWITFLDDDDRMLPGHVSGLLQAAIRNGASVVHSFARAVFSNGRIERFGQPFCLSELYERNYIQLSTALFARRLVEGGCRFDESLPIHEDWDFFLQLAQHVPFHFEPVQSFDWHADAGTSGAGGGRNQDDNRFATVRDRVYAKWRDRHDALIDAVREALGNASAAASAGAFEQAIAHCRGGLARSPNDPHLLGFLAMLAKRTGRLDDALRFQSMAVSVRPHDADLRVNLASVLLAANRVDMAREALLAALVCDPGHATARTRLAALDAAAKRR